MARRCVLLPELKRPWLLPMSIVFVLHFLWEVVHSRWYVTMEGLSLWVTIVVWVRASLGDVVITVIAFASAAAATRAAEWPLGRRVVAGSAVFVATGLAITVVSEVFAVRTGRWIYSDTMPTIAGVGLSPLLQWIVLPFIEIAIFRIVGRHRGLVLRKARSPELTPPT